MSNRNSAGEPHEYYMSLTFFRGGLLDGYTCPNCGQQHVGSLQVHNCRPRDWPRPKPLPTIPTPWPPAFPWIPPDPFPIVPITPPPASGWWCSVCGTFVPDNVSHTCIGPKPQPKPDIPGTRQPFTCPKCNGEGKVRGKNCRPCKGTGIVWG